LKALSLNTLITGAIGVGLACVAEPFTVVLLGEKWRSIADIMAWLSLLGVFGSVNYLYSPLLKAMGKTRTHAMLDVYQFLVVVPTVFFAATYGEAALVAAGRFGSIFLILPVTFWLISRQLDIGFSELASAVFRPAISAASMAAVLVGVGGMGIENQFLLLISKVALGGSVFLLVHFLLCMFAGIKETVEYELLQKLLPGRFR